MTGINYLVPGYTEQGFAYARSSLYEGVAWLEEKQKFVGYLSKPFVYLIETASTYCLELPIKLIEDIALTIINLIGAIFSQECRGHLKECFIQLFEDVKKVIPIIIIASPLLYPLFPPSLPLSIALLGASAGSIGLLGLKACDSIYENPQQKTDYYLIPFYRTQAIRLHGYSKVSEFETLLGLNRVIFNTEKVSNKIPSEVLTFYKKLVEGEEETKKNFLETTLNKERERVALMVTKKPADLKPESVKGWTPIPALENDPSPTATAIQRILYLSEKMDPSTMNQEQIYVYLANLLGTLPSELHIVDAWQTTHIILHEEKNAGTKYEEQAHQAREILNQALSYSVIRETGLV